MIIYIHETSKTLFLLSFMNSIKKNMNHLRMYVKLLKINIDKIK